MSPAPIQQLSGYKNPVNFGGEPPRPKVRDLIGGRKWSDVLGDFHKYYYATADDPTWLGYPVMKVPGDMLMYQEILFQTRPEVIIETGTAYGGSALFLASVCEMLKTGEVITIDLPKDGLHLPQHGLITYLTGGSTEARIIRRLQELVRGRTCMVILDSDHSYHHVKEELRLYAPMVTKGKYLIVEDTNINGHPVAPHLGAGPMEATQEFLKGNKSFAIDRSRERFYMTYNPDGYLLRIKD